MAASPARFRIKITLSRSADPPLTDGWVKRGMGRLLYYVGEPSYHANAHQTFVSNLFK